MKTLLLRSGTRHVAIPIEAAAETFRPLPVEAVAGAPAFVLGLAVVRGAPVPVVDVAALLGVRNSAPAGRFVRVRAGTRTLVLAAESVTGVRSVPGSALLSMPRLSEGAAADAVDAIGALDEEILVLLRTARIVDDAAWRALDSAEARP